MRGGNILDVTTIRTCNREGVSTPTSKALHEHRFRIVLFNVVFIILGFDQHLCVQLRHEVRGEDGRRDDRNRHGGGQARVVGHLQRGGTERGEDGGSSGAVEAVVVFVIAVACRRFRCCCLLWLRLGEAHLSPRVELSSSTTCG